MKHVLAADLIFDLDGTLLNVWNRLYTTYVETTTKLSLSPLSFESYREISRFSDAHKRLLPTVSVEPYLRYFRAEVESEKKLRLDRLYESVPEILQELSTFHTLHLLTKRQAKERTQQQLKYLHIASFFSSITIESSILKKESLKTIKRTHERCFIIGDTEEDMTAGYENNIPTVFASYGLKDPLSVPEIKKTHLISDIKEVIQVINRK